MPNQLERKVELTVAPSMNMTDSPAPMLVMAFRATEDAKLLELSSNLQPVIFTGLVPLLVNSNQSAPTGELPLDHGATSVMKILDAAWAWPAVIATTVKAAPKADLASDNQRLRRSGLTVLAIGLEDGLKSQGE